MNFERERIGRTLREVVLTVGAVLGAIAIVVAVGAVAFGLRPLVFRSGSMSPTIGTGDLALARQVGADDLRVGQIVSVPTQGGERVTHRIVEVEHQAHGVALLRLRGDANTVDDAETYRVTHADKVLFSVPALGYVVAWLSGSTGRFLLGIYAAFLLMTIFRRAKRDSDESAPGGAREARNPATEPATGRGSTGAARIGTVALVALGVLSVGLAASRATSTLAAWNDTAEVTGTTFASYTVPQPTLTCLAGTPSSTTNTQHMTYTWPGSVDPGTTYTVSVTGLGVAPTTTQTGTTTKSLDISYDSSQASNKNVVATLTVSPALTASPTWTGPQALTKFKTAATAKNPGLCGEADPPASVVIGAPDATTRSIANEKTFITTTCTTSTVILCGSYDDASTVTMTYTLKRTQSGVVKCWTGSWSNAQAGGVCSTFQAGTTATVSGVKTFSEAANQATVFPSTGAGDYVLTVKLVDAFSNTTTDSVSFTLTP